MLGERIRSHRMVINIHITPRERERLIREERQRRRVARILQKTAPVHSDINLAIISFHVRQQASEQAQLIRQNLRKEKENKVEELRKELRRSVSEKVSDIVAEEQGISRLPLPSDSSTVSTTTSARTRSSTRTPHRHHHTFTRQDAIRALERGRLAQDRLRAERLAARREAINALWRRRQAIQDANRFNMANPTSR
ncbi:hypothetical protein V3C99_012749 [Haemonchus contortus]